MRTPANPLALTEILSHACATFLQDKAMTQTPIAQFLAPLAKLALKFPAVEGAVLWGDAEGWQVQDDSTELLDAEEIAFYAEGLLMEGFGMIWQAIADAATPKDPDHILLMFWEGPAVAPPPPPSEEWVVMAQGAWRGTEADK